MNDIEQYWRYLINLDNDMKVISRYIEITENNFRTYSMEILKLLLSTCTEVDVICRLICKSIDSSLKFDDFKVTEGDMDEYKKVIFKKCPIIADIEITVHGLSDKIKPWSTWKYNKNPQWWQFYNLVKHYRHNNFKQANLKNVLHALSGLIVLLHVYYAINKHDSAVLENKTSCFFSEYMYDPIVAMPQKELKID